ncbi:MAG: carbohydrate kinase family protein [Candidatus Nanopusillus acidilobi]
MKQNSIISLPDLFLDIITKKIDINKNTGNINQEIRLKIGGNAANFSIALGKIGIKNKLIAGCNKISELIFRQYIKDKKLKIRFLPIYTDISITISLEDDDRIMITYPKGIQIGINEIKKYEKIIKKTEYIFFGNWNNNKKSNELLKYIINLNRDAKIYLDIGDPSINIENLNELIKILKENKIWVLSLNEYELEYLGDFLKLDYENLLDLANKLYKILNVEHLDIHSPDFVYSLPSNIYIKIKKVKPIILTGAGDTWNAGNFYGYLNNLDNKDRLLFANEIAKKYILNEF